MNTLRSDLAALANKNYFNFGGQGPLPTTSLEAIITSWMRIQELGPFTNDVWPYIANEIDTTKIQLAQICGVTKNRIALTENVTSGCVLPLWGLPVKEGERILISDCEHPGVVAACKEFAQRNGLEIDIFKVQDLREGVGKENETNQLVIKMLNNQIKPSTKIVVLSHILWNTGQIMPINLIGNLLRNYPNHPFLLVDAAQSFGQIPIKGAASVADVFAFTGHKWSLGPEGLGGVALSERVLKEIRPTLIGWKSLIHEKSIYDSNSEPFHKDGRRFEIATSCTPLLAGFRQSMNLLAGEGSDSERIAKIKSLSKKLWSKLNDIDGIIPILNGHPPTGLVSFLIDASISPHKVVKDLGQQSIWIRALEDPIWLRACVHLMSTEEEIQSLVIALKNIVSKYKA